MGWYRMYMLAPNFKEEYLELFDYPEEILISKLDGRDGTNDFKCYVEKSPDALLMARRFGYEQAFRDAAKRTCQIDDVYSENQEHQVWHYELSCGHTAYISYKTPPKYCSECGAKVLE